METGKKAMSKLLGLSLASVLMSSPMIGGGTIEYHPSQRSGNPVRSTLSKKQASARKKNKQASKARRKNR